MRWHKKRRPHYRFFIAEHPPKLLRLNNHSDHSYHVKIFAVQFPLADRITRERGKF